MQLYYEMRVAMQCMNYIDWNVICMKLTKDSRSCVRQWKSLVLEKLKEKKYSEEYKFINIIYTN